MSKFCHSPLVVDVTCPCADMHYNMYCVCLVCVLSVCVLSVCVLGVCVLSVCVCVCVDGGNLNEVLSWKYGYISINVGFEIKMMLP